MTTQIKVLRENLINTLSSVKEDNVSIADVTINRRKLLEALKLQTQDDILTLTYGKVSWEAKVKNEACIQFSCNHTTMRFLNRPKSKTWQEPKVIPLNFVDGFVDQEAKPELTGIPIDPQELIKALAFVLPCVVTETSRPILNCILFYSGHDVIKLVTADGFRLGISRVIAKAIPTDKVLIELADIQRLMVFLKAVKPIGWGKGKCYPDVYLSYSKKTIKFATKDGYIELDKQKYTFPDYKRLMPSKGTKVEFISNDMLRAVKALSNIANDGSGAIRLNFSKGKPCGKITLTARSEEYGQSSVECDALVKSACKIAVNARYLKDLMSLCKDSRVIARVKHYTNPILFNIGDDKQCLVMPMFVQW